jgi:CHAT domain-containing protein
MKINRVEGTNNNKMSWKDNLFMNIYHFLSFYKLIVAIIFGLAVGALMILLALDYMAPKELSAIDRKATLGLFDDLQKANRHQDAIDLMEFKLNAVLKNNPEELIYKTKLADSYVHVGDYSKAEKMLLDVIKNADSYMADPDYGEELAQHPEMKALTQFGLSRNIYQLYENMGDSVNQVKYFNLYKSYLDKCPVNIVDSLMALASKKMPWYSNAKSANIWELVEYDSIVCASFADRGLAIKKMKSFIDKIINRKDFGTSYKVRCLNKLIRWQLDDSRLIDAYSYLGIALEIANKMTIDNEYSVLGELSDLCYEVHDIDMSRQLFNLYQKYLDKTYRKTDFEYLSNYARTFRYMEADNDWDNLIESLTDYCIGMRRQISLNIPSMTENQREFLAKQFDVAFNYAFDALKKHPCDELARLCFDNVTFRSGLLLRSNSQIANSIEALDDDSVKNMFAELKECRMNLVYQSVAGNKILKNTSKIEARINELEKEIALKCTDFKNRNASFENDYSTIAARLSDEESIVEMIEHEGDLFALVITNKKTVEYVPIGRYEQIISYLKNPIEEIYHNKTLTDVLWSKVSGIVNDKSVVYYVPVGKFNQFALGSLYIGDNKYLSDVKDLRLISNPTDILSREPFHLAANTTNISLWGGIDYGLGNAVEEAPIRSAISRGETLANLRYAYQEVSDISLMLSNKQISNKVYSSYEATEQSFKNRNGKKDYVLHISTHGFFNEKSDQFNSMLESGLFFAGANKYWSNDTLRLEPEQDDGILRAAEISELNLSGCSLVVLSACETGLGYSDTSEGIFGLQRAFKLAGANYVLMSLWDVDDRATAMLMTEFYNNLLNNVDLDTALKNSKKRVREFYPSPKDWGGFVLLH